MKGVQKSVRLSEQNAKFIDEYRGDNFNDKLGNLIEDYADRRDELVLEWDRLQAMCTDKRSELERLRKQISDYAEVHWTLRPLLDALEELLPK